MARAPRTRAPAASLAAACFPLLAGCISLPIHNINLLGGSRMLDESAWEPVDRQRVFGIEADTYKPRGGIGVELGAQFSKDEESAFIPLLGEADVTGRTFELYAGARKTFAFVHDRLFPYIGMGISYIDVDFDVDFESGSESDSGSSFGVYVRGGVYWNFAGNWHVGMDLRRLFGTEVDILGVESDADYVQFALFVGFAF